MVGAVYCDCGLRLGGFTGEGVQGSSVLVIKTHRPVVQFVGGRMFSSERIPYGAAVLLVRDPRSALVAEWNREKTKKLMSQNISNHFAYVGQYYFGKQYCIIIVSGDCAPYHCMNQYNIIIMSVAADELHSSYMYGIICIQAANSAPSWHHFHSKQYSHRNSV